MENNNLFLTSITHHVIKKCSDKWSLNHEVLSFYDLTFVVDGEAVYIIDGKEYHLHSGEAIFIKKGSTRQAYTFPENPMVCVAFNFDLLVKDELILNEYFKWDDSYKLKIYFKELNYEWLHRKSNYQMKCNSLLNLIICEILEFDEKSEHNRRVEEMQEMIVNNFNKPITVKEVAKIFNLHPAYCGALFKQVTGMSILKYANQIRINQAKNMLIEKDLTVGEIGNSVGLDDPYYFSKIFKSFVGLSPLEYRKLHV